MDDDQANDPQQSEDVHNEETDPALASLATANQPEEYGWQPPDDHEAQHNSDTFTNPAVGSMTTRDISDQVGWQERQEEQTASGQ